MDTTMKKVSKRKNLSPKKIVMPIGVKPVEIYSCQLCSFETDRSFNLNRHVKKRHCDKHFFCCGQIFTTAFLYDVHKALVKHKEKGYDCAVCKSNLKHRFNFKTRSSFDRHMLSHSGARPYPCSICSYAATTKSNLKRHSKQHKESCGSTSTGSTPESTSQQPFSPIILQQFASSPVLPCSVSTPYKLCPFPDAQNYYGLSKI